MQTESYTRERSTTRPERDYREGFWFLYDRLCALRFGMTYPCRDDAASLRLLREVTDEAIDDLTMWLQPLAIEDHSYDSSRPCACGSERNGGGDGGKA